MAEKLVTAKKRKIRFSDVVALVVCFLIAFSIWYYVMLTDNPEYEQSFTVNGLEIKNSSALSGRYNLSVIGGYDTAFEITVKGRKSDIVKHTASDFTVSVDLDKVNSVGVYTLEPKVDLPDGLTLENISPATAEITIDKLSSKTVEITSKLFEVRYSADSSIGTPVVNPSTVTLTGPASLLENIKEAAVDLNLGEITESIVAVAPIYLTDSDGNTVDNPYVLKSDDSASVTVPLYIQKSVELKTDFLHGYLNDSNCTVTVTPSSLTLVGEKSSVGNLEAILLKTYDEKSISSSFTEVVTVPIPAGAVSKDGRNTVTVKVMLNGVSSKTFSVTNINIRGSGYISLVDGNGVDVVVCGPAHYINALTEDDIVLSVSVANITASGDYRLEAEVQFPAGYQGKVYELGTYYVNVRKK